MKEREEIIYAIFWHERCSVKFNMSIWLHKTSYQCVYF